jgi:hypothetical protein
MLPGEREQFRIELTRVLTDAFRRVQLEPTIASYVEDFIDNYEFGLAYEFMMEGLKGKDVPADAAAALKAAGIRMGYEISN